MCDVVTVGADDMGGFCYEYSAQCVAGWNKYEVIIMWSARYYQRIASGLGYRNSNSHTVRLLCNKLETV